MQGTYVHLRLGLILSSEHQAKLVEKPLAEALHLRLKRFEYAHDASDFVREQRPKVVIADYERFGAAGIYGLADFMAEAECPFILIVRDTSEWEHEQFIELGVQAVFQRSFSMKDMVSEVGIALKKGRRIGSSERLPVVTS